MGNITIPGHNFGSANNASIVSFSSIVGWQSPYPTVPVVPGDVIIAFAYSWNRPITGTPPDFVRVGTSHIADSAMTAWAKTVLPGATTGPYTFTFGGSGYHSVHLLLLRGADPTRPVVGVGSGYYTYGNSTAGVGVSPGATVTPTPQIAPDGIMALRCVGTGWSGTSGNWVWPTGITERIDSITSSGIRYMSTATAGSESAKAVFPDASPRFSSSIPGYNAAITLAIQPRRRAMIDDRSRGILSGVRQLEFNLTPP